MKLRLVRRRRRSDDIDETYFVTPIEADVLGTGDFRRLMSMEDTLNSLSNGAGDHWYVQIVPDNAEDAADEKP